MIPRTPFSGALNSFTSIPSQGFEVACNCPNLSVKSMGGGKPRNANRKNPTFPERMTILPVRIHHSKFNNCKLREGGVRRLGEPDGRKKQTGVAGRFWRFRENQIPGARVNRQPGLPALRERDEAMGLTGKAAEFFRETNQAVREIAR